MRKHTFFSLSLCVLLIASSVTRKHWYRPQLEKNDRWPQYGVCIGLKIILLSRYLRQRQSDFFYKMSLDRAHTSIKQTARVMVTGIISDSARSSDQQNYTKFNRDIFNFYLREALSAVLAMTTCLAGWLGWVSGWLSHTSVLYQNG